MMTVEETRDTIRCHAAILDTDGMPMKTCYHDHGFDLHAAAMCALHFGWNGAVEFKMKAGVRVRTLDRFDVGRSHLGQTIRTL
jgi:hypothetical protein